MKKILITGAAGFIGYHLVKHIVSATDATVVGIDNINDYYDVNLKLDRLEQCGILRQPIAYNQPIKSTIHPNYTFRKLDLTDNRALRQLFAEEQFDQVVNLAAQAGVRYSLENPEAYIQSNLVGFANLLECCRNHPVAHLAYASSSSVYGMSEREILSETDCVDYPVSLYAATKKSDELMAHAYSHLYQIPTTGLRFFTVYGPWGRPDMSPMLFADKIYNDKPLALFNNGDMERDFTYVGDIVESIARVLTSPPDTSEPHPYYRILNVGNSSPVKLLDFVETLETAIGKTAQKEMKPMQPGDVRRTYADTTRLEQLTGYRPQTTLRDGIAAFIDWYKDWHLQQK